LKKGIVFTVLMVISFLLISLPIWARPSLEFDPDDAKRCEKEFTISVRNGGNIEDLEKNTAKTVIIGWEITKGGEYVDSVMFTHPSNFPYLGNILPGAKVDIKGEIVTNASWDTAKLNTEVKIRFFVVNEDNDPLHNESAYRPSLQAHYTLIQCRPFVEWSIDATQIHWRVLKPGVYIVSEGIKLWIKSNVGLDITLTASDLENTEDKSDKIATWYAIGESLEKAESFGWKKSFTIPLPPAPSATTIHIWNKIEVTEKNSACEYKNGTTIKISLRENLRENLKER